MSALQKSRRERDHPAIFLSHAQADSDNAKKLKDWLISTFDNKVQVFASSDWQSIEPGKDWYETIDHALRDCTLGIILLTETSIQRPWVNYELGALRASNKRTIPLCVGQVRKATLPSPFVHSQGCDYDNKKDLSDLLQSLANIFDFPKWIPSEAIENAPVLSSHPIPQLSSRSSSHSLPIELLFKSDDRWTTLAYTCRATFTGETCIIGGPIKKSLWTHIPVDEIQTVCVAINHLMPNKLRTSEDDTLETVKCSKAAQGELLGNSPIANQPDHIPSLINRDLIIIGQNNLSDLLLQMMQAYLPWQAGTGQVARRMQELRPHVYVELAPQFNRPVSAAQRPEVHKGGAMIAIFPNPFNIRKRVLVLFGCHREGQLTLENWLGSEEAGEIIESIEHTEKRGTWALQIIVDRTLGPVARRVQGIRNSITGQGFWLTVLNSSPIDDSIVINKSCNQPYRILDLSLVIPLSTDDQQQLIRIVRSYISLPDIYWEHEQCEIGLHVTLYEFLTHHRPDSRLISHFEMVVPYIRDVLCSKNNSEKPRAITAKIRGIEFLPTAMIAYVDFTDDEGQYSNWLDSVRQWSEQSVAGTATQLGEIGLNLLNAMKVPFPVHVTLCRFNRELTELEQAQLRKIAGESRLLELLRISVRKICLTVATESPYRKVRVTGEISLT